MKLPRRKLLVEPPQSAASDIAFILIVFFLVCASVQPDSGRNQQIPQSEETEDQAESKNIEVGLTRDAVLLDGAPMRLDAFSAQIKTALAKKTSPGDRVVLVKSRQDTPYSFWIQVTEVIEQAGGIVTLQIEEQQTILR